MKLWITPSQFRTNISGRNCINPYLMSRIFQCCTFNHHIQTSHSCIVNGMSSPRLFTCRWWKNSCTSLCLSHKWHAYWKNLHRWPYVYLKNQIVFWQIAINPTHKVNDSMAKEYGVDFSIEAPEHRMCFICYLECIYEINLESIYLLWGIVRWDLNPL